MQSVKILLRENGYNITIGDQTLKDLGEAVKNLKIGSEAVVVTNPGIKKFHGAVFSAGLKKAGIGVKFLEVPDGEKSKSAPQAFSLIERIAEHNAGKELFIVAFGGGVIGDLAGFVAAVYKRGVPYIQVPTTLLAQVDSSIGGKVGVDLPMGKNLVGAFFQPSLVWSDVSVLKTLTVRQIRNGLAEVVKYGVICDKILFDYVDKNAERLLTGDPKALTEVVLNCSRIKAKVVMSDEKETKGVRTILNFGHTVGHAIEAANHFQNFQHGEAVALGMRVALKISVKMGLLKQEISDRVEHVLTKLGLPEEIENLKVSEIVDHMRHDKKFKGKTNKFVLATGIGSVKVVEGISSSLIQSAIRDFI